MTKKKLFEAFETALEELYYDHVDKRVRKWKERPMFADNFKEELDPYLLTDYADPACMEYYRHLEPCAFEKYGDAYDEILSRHIVRLAIQFLRSDVDVADVAHDYFDEKARESDAWAYYGVSKSNYYGVK